MSKIKISVIMTVYNTALFLQRAVTSVLQQDFSNLELIIVNDGSKDNSEQICREFMAADNRIVFINQHNQGAAAARNNGFAKATGDYVVFLDSDDNYSQGNAISVLADAAAKTDCDAVCFNYNRTGEDGELLQKNVIDYSGANLQLTLKELIENNIYTSSSCLKLIKRQRIEDIKFEEQLSCEDILFSFQALLKCRNICFVNESFYNYTVRAGSQTNSITEKTVTDTVYSIDKMQQMLTDETADKELYMSYIAFQYCTALININLAKCSKDILKKVYSSRYLLKYNCNRYVKIIYLTSKFAGIKLTSRLLGIYFKLKNKR